jgi:hypothetical protein
MGSEEGGKMRLKWLLGGGEMALTYCSQIFRSKKTGAGSGHRKDKKMKIRAQVIVESDNGVGEIVQDVARLERGHLRPEELDLTLTEGVDHRFGQ